MLTKYLTNEVDLKELAKKACVKSLLYNLLDVSTVGISNQNRSLLYNFVVSKIFTFKQENPMATSTEEIKKCLADCVKLKIEEFSNKRGPKIDTASSSLMTSLKIEKDDVTVKQENIQEATTSSEDSSIQKFQETSVVDDDVIFVQADVKVEKQLEVVANFNTKILKKKENRKSRNDSIGSSSSFDTTSISSCDLYGKANSAEFQPTVKLNSAECEIELEKLNKKLTMTEVVKIDELKEVEGPKNVMTSDEIETCQAPMVRIPSTTFEFGMSSPLQEEIQDEPVCKPKKKIGPKKIKQRRSTHKSNQVNPHYNIENYFTRTDSHSKKQNSLIIDIVPNKLCNFSFQLHPTSFDLSLQLEEVTQTQPVTGMDINKLLYWPGVGVCLSLPEIEIVRYCNANIYRELVPVHADLDANEIKANNKSLFRFYKNRTIQSINPPEKDIELSQIMVLTYLELVLKALSITKFTKQDELEKILKAFLSDLSMSNRCYLKTCFSYFCNTYPYNRSFHPKSQPRDNGQVLVLRETFNPEIVFVITRCNFEINGNINMHGLADYFKPIIFEKSPQAIAKFNHMLSKGYSVHCVECKDDQNGQFSGPIKIALLSEHLGEVCINSLECVRCSYQEKINNLSSCQWRHECKI